MVEVDLILEVEEEVGVNQDEPSVVSYRLASHLQVLHFDLLYLVKPSTVPGWMRIMKYVFQSLLKRFLSLLNHYLAPFLHIT